MVIIVTYKGLYAMFFLIYCLYYIHLRWWPSLIDLLIILILIIQMQF